MFVCSYFENRNLSSKLKFKCSYFKNQNLSSNLKLKSILAFWPSSFYTANIFYLLNTFFIHFLCLVIYYIIESKKVNIERNQKMAYRKIDKYDYEACREGEAIERLNRIRPRRVKGKKSKLGKRVA